MLPPTRDLPAIQKLLRLDPAGLLWQPSVPVIFVLSHSMQHFLLALAVTLCAGSYVPLPPRSQPQPECSTPRLGSGKRCTTITVQLSGGPNDELKVRFSRGDDEIRTSFLPKEPARSATAEAEKPTPPGGSNEQLIAEIRALMPEEIPPAPEKEPINLNGIKPTDLLIGAAAYGFTCWASWQFTNTAGQFFADRTPCLKSDIPSPDQHEHISESTPREFVAPERTQSTARHPL